MENQTVRAAGLIVAAGGSRRMGFDKITAPLAGRPLVTWSLQAFEACDDIGPCVLVCGSRAWTSSKRWQHLIKNSS